MSGSTSRTDAQTLYVVCRALEPDPVVETGIKYGSSDTHITAALAQNGHGTLHGIDLPEEPEYGFGYLIPDELESYWEFHLRDVKDVLPSLLEELEPIDLFLHDSSHMKDHMQWEYEIAYPYLRSGGMLASHDVLGSDVFQSFCEQKELSGLGLGMLG